MLKFGLISDLDIENGLARVYFEEDDFVSAWLKISVSRSKGDQFSFPFNIDEHVWCLMDEDWEYGVIGGAIYDQGNLPAGASKGVLKMSFTDLSSIVYDGNSHTLTLDIKGDVNIICNKAKIEAEGNVEVNANKISITAVTTEIDGILKVSGAAEIQGIVSMGGLSGISGAAVDGGNSELSVSKLNAADDVKVGNISLKEHKHTSNSPGNPTSPAVP